MFRRIHHDCLRAVALHVSAPARPDAIASDEFPPQFARIFEPPRLARSVLKPSVGPAGAALEERELAASR